METDKMTQKTNKNTDHCQLQALAYPLLRLAEQKPNDSGVGGHAEAAVDITRKVSESMKIQDNEPDFKASWLPTEIYQMIVNHIALDYNESNHDESKIRAKTLSSLARTCRSLQCLSEPYLYSFPQSSRLKGFGGQKHFRLAMAVESRRANLIQVLDFALDSERYSRRLVIDIARRCPNLHTLKLRCVQNARLGVEITQNYVDDLADLFSVCPKVRKLGLFIPFPEGSPIPLQKRLIAEFSKNLTHVKLDGGGAWFQRVMLPHLSRNMISLSMLAAGDGNLSDFLLKLSQRCSAMQRLELNCDKTTSVDLIRFCKASGPSLKFLSLDNLDYNGSIVSQFFYHMQALQDFHLGPDFPFYVKDITAMSKQSCLRTFISESDEIRPGNAIAKKASTALNHALARFLSAHMLTLKTIWLDGEFLLDKNVFEN
ncbi:uncharacterized protein BKA55DRAFT_742194 [Fusarium redolens]|uniref:Uncharacterized protein n=1 Tax=Fusarium redolens TaxID=48865 RepID=A0A9P9G7W0_FUSRE|nr:uncharacterized protein BKA55DRAFT_742194 [Fusarium redolens]KAH7234685.1 hypothetical protein BKA55DRAFT_742194 [Fusarium redolens]